MTAHPMNKGSDAERFAHGQPVYYVNDEDPDYPVQLRATIVGDVEGWLEIRLWDGSHAIVRPSRVRALTKLEMTTDCGAYPATRASAPSLLRVSAIRRVSGL